MTELSLDVMRLRSQDEFEDWQMRDLGIRDELIELLGADPGLDAGSLLPLERFLLDRYARPEDALRLNERPVLDAAARQVGLVLILGSDGDAGWTIDLENHDNLYFGLPVVSLPDGSTECPLSLVSASLDRRTGHYLRDIAVALTADN